MNLPTFQNFDKHNKGLALLFDPDKYSETSCQDVIRQAENCDVDFIFVGGSLIFNGIEILIEQIKSLTSIPVILFPGSILQVSPSADAILLLSLVSGRNPEYLIGNHVIMAPFIKKSGLEVIPTAYMIVDGGVKTAVEYVSNTAPLPSDKPDLAVATALAGELLGMKLLYLDAGSGAKYHVSASIIKAVSEETNVPLIVGGGIRTADQASKAYSAGADIIVVGNALEKSSALLQELCEVKESFKFQS